MLTPIIDKLADQFVGKAKIGKVNVDENPDLAVQYGIVNIPRVLIFKGSDKPLHTIVGLTDERSLAAKLNDALQG
jgi:thioredoxin 1